MRVGCGVLSVSYVCVVLCCVGCVECCFGREEVDAFDRVRGVRQHITNTTNTTTATVADTWCSMGSIQLSLLLWCVSGIR